MSKNFGWGIKNDDIPSEMRVALFVSRNKDNKDIDGFKERRMAFVTNENRIDELKRNFETFAAAGLPGETSRLYISVNARDGKKVRCDLLHYLIDNDDVNLCNIEGILAKLAAKKENALTKRWMFDFDIDNEKMVYKFLGDLTRIDDTLNPSINKTPHGYAVIVEHGFDTRELYKKWDPSEVNLKKDDLLCIEWRTLNGKI